MYVNHHLHIVALATIATGVLTGMIGCASTAVSLPTYAWHDASRARQLIIDRAASVRTVSARCEITLHDPQHGSVEFDGVMVASPPTSLRIRAYKLGQPALDLTVRPDGVWIWMTDRAEVDARQLVPTTLTSPDRIFVPLLGDQIAGDAHAVAGIHDDTLVLTRDIKEASGGMLVATFDRHTLTIRSYEMLDADRRTSRRVVLDNYRVVDGTPLPGQITAINAEGTKLIIRLHDVSLNETLPDTAFKPPARARQIAESTVPPTQP